MVCMPLSSRSIPAAIALTAASALFPDTARWLSARPLLLVATVSAGLLLPDALTAAWRNYRGYLALGPGGIPHNVVGWLIQAIAQPFAARDPLDTAPFEHPSAAVVARYGGRARATKSYLDIDTTLTARRGERPTVPGYVAPQRQTTEPASAETRAAQEVFLRAVAAANPTLLDIRPSQLEGAGTAALWVKRGLSLGRDAVAAAGARRLAPVEIVHGHPEGSSHMQLSLGDAYLVVKAGWGERHRLAGQRVAHVAPTYLFVYAPRDAAELRLWQQLVLAAARFAVGADDVDLEDPKL